MSLLYFVCLFFFYQSQHFIIDICKFCWTCHHEGRKGTFGKSYISNVFSVKENLIVLNNIVSSSECQSAVWVDKFGGWGYFVFLSDLIFLECLFSKYLTVTQSFYKIKKIVVTLKKNFYQLKPKTLKRQKIIKKFFFYFYSVNFFYQLNAEIWSSKVFFFWFDLKFLKTFDSIITSSKYITF